MQHAHVMVHLHPVDEHKKYPPKSQGPSTKLFECILILFHCHLCHETINSTGIEPAGQQQCYSNKSMK